VVRHASRQEGGSALVPIIRLKEYLVVPIQGTLEDHQAIRLQEDILLKIESSRAKGVIIDISAVPIMDSYIARILNNIARNSRLMGARGVIVGMRPAIAITLVTMGLEFDNIETALNLDLALELLEGGHGV
jgi:rsbT antagonist protein RsbS